MTGIMGVTGRPVGIKTAIGGWEFINELCNAVLRRGRDCAPDFLAIDGGEGGSGASPQTLMGHMSLAIAEALPPCTRTQARACAHRAVGEPEHRAQHAVSLSDAGCPAPSKSRTQRGRDVKTASTWGLRV